MTLDRFKRAPTTVRLSKDEMDRLRLRYGSVQAALDNVLKDALGPWHPKMPPAYLPMWAKLRELVALRETNRLGHRATIEYLTVELDLAETTIVRRLKFLADHRVIQLTMGISDGTILVPRTPEELTKIGGGFDGNVYLSTDRPRGDSTPSGGDA